MSAEARIIRFEEKRQAGDIRESLYLHRIGVVRVECRASHLLHMYAKYCHIKSLGRDPGKWSYKRVEPNADPNCWWRSQAFRRANEMGKRFEIDTAGFKDWVNQ